MNWQPQEEKLRNHWLATQAWLCVLDLARQLGPTLESAKAAGPIKKQNAEAYAWFNPSLSVIAVRFAGAEAAGAQSALVTLAENGFHGYAGPFEVDFAKLDGDHVVIQLSGPCNDRTTMPDPNPTLVCHA